MQNFNKKVLLFCFLSPIVVFFPWQLCRHFYAQGYGGYFDQPGIGWVISYCFIMGGLSGAVTANITQAGSPVLLIENLKRQAIIEIVSISVPLPAMAAKEQELLKAFKVSSHQTNTILLIKKLGRQACGC